MENAQQPRDHTIIVLAICASIYAVYLPVAVFLGRAHLPVALRAEIVEPISDIKHIEGFGYQARTPRLIRYADDDPDNQRSPIILHENMTPLGPAHSVHADVQEIGRGRYSHWNDNPKSGWRTIRDVLFSASHGPANKWPELLGGASSLGEAPSRKCGSPAPTRPIAYSAVEPLNVRAPLQSFKSKEDSP